MRYAVLALAVAGLARASNSTLIPAGITASCTTFLEQLNSDDTLSSCIQPLINATASFSPAASNRLSPSAIDTSLASLCKSADGCSDSVIRSWLSNFYASCQTELASSAGYNADVRQLYDIIYVFQPLKGAVCSIDSANQDYCVNEILSSSKNSSSQAAAPAAANSSTLVTLLETTSTSPVTFAANNLYYVISSASGAAKRALNYLSPRENSQSVNMATIIAPNATTYRTTNLPFLFLEPTMPSSTLCTPCTREVMVAYVKWESAVPYALGLSASPILGGQGGLWSAINSTCGANFIQAINSEVGSLAASSNATAMSGAEGRWAPAGKSAATTAAVGIAVVAGAMAFL